MTAIKNGNVLQFICTMLRDGEPIDLTGATVKLLVQPRHNVIPAFRPDCRLDFVGEVLDPPEEGRVSATYTLVDLHGAWKVSFQVTLPGGEIINSEDHEFDVEPNIGDDPC